MNDIPTRLETRARLRDEIVEDAERTDNTAESEGSACDLKTRIRFRILERYLKTVRPITIPPDIEPKDGT